MPNCQITNANRSNWCSGTRTRVLSRTIKLYYHQITLSREAKSDLDELSLAFHSKKKQVCVPIRLFGKYFSLSLLPLLFVRVSSSLFPPTVYPTDCNKKHLLLLPPWWTTLYRSKPHCFACNCKAIKRHWPHEYIACMDPMLLMFPVLWETRIA